jgi:regulator of sirC expression with transglutaminase-like and TPR domain
MRAESAREALLDIAAQDGDVAAGSLWLAAEDDPEVEPQAWLERVDALAAELRSRCGIRGCGIDDAPLVASLLRDRLQLHGAGGGDPRAHYLHTVLASGAGMPITCSAIWIAVGRRAEIPIEGVNLPGHFLVRVGSQLFDALDGAEPLDEAATAGLIESATGARPDRVDPEWLHRAGTRDILVRMSRNLRGCYTALERWECALRAADRCVALLPDDPVERRDRGLLLWRLGQARLALCDLRFYLDQTPPAASDHKAVAEVAGRLRSSLN